MAMEWLRWYHGACSDPKWAAIARKSRTNVGTVVAIWAAMLEYASQQPERGSLRSFDAETVDAMYGYDDGTCAAVISAMESKNIIVDGHISAWGKRQRESDNSTARVQKYRENKKNARSETAQHEEAEEQQQNMSNETQCNADETLQSVSCNANETQNCDETHQSTDNRLQTTDNREQREDFKGVTSAKPAPTLPPDGGVPPLESFDLSGECSPKPPSDNCPHQKIVELYHEILPGLPHVRIWDDTDRANLRARWREDKARQNLDWWRGFFEYVSHSDFLMGRTHGRDGKPFFANLGWLVTARNFKKTVNGNYNHEALDVFQQAAISGYRGMRENGGVPDWGPLREESDFIDIEAQESEV